MKEEFQCPVCTEQFQAPIRTLPSCGHNFCERCLDNFLTYNSGPLRCPTCRGNFEFRDVGAFVRNRDLESALEHIKETKNKSVQEQLEENAISCMLNKKYEDALTQINAIVLNETEEADKLTAFLMKAQCNILLDKFDKAVEEYNKFKEIFSSLFGGNCSMPPEKVDKCDDLIKDLFDAILSMNVFEKTGKKLTRGPKWISKIKNALPDTMFNNKEAKIIDFALLIIRSRAEFIKLFYKDQAKPFLMKLSDCGRQMENLFNKGAKIDQQHYLNVKPWMQELLEALQGIGTTDVQTKSQYVASFYHSYAVCSYKVGEIEKANELCLQASAVMKTVFASKANNYKVMSFCFLLLGQVKARKKDHQNAQSLFDQALLRAEIANDWNQQKNDEKSRFLERTTKKREKAKNVILTLPTTAYQKDFRRLSVFKD